MLTVASDLPSLTTSDFNEIMLQHEKLGGFPLQQLQMVVFWEALSDAGLEDLFLQVQSTTWSKYVIDGAFVQERLDRAVANSQ